MQIVSIFLMGQRVILTTCILIQVLIIFRNLCAVTSMPSLYTARNSQMSSYEAFSNNVFSIQAHQARVHQRLILAPSHDPTRLARLAQNPYKVMCSKCAVTLFSRNTQRFLIAAHTYLSQRHARA